MLQSIFQLYFCQRILTKIDFKKELNGPLRCDKVLHGREYGRILNINFLVFRLISHYIDYNLTLVIVGMDGFCC